jgi:hypothetical protein
MPVIKTTQAPNGASVAFHKIQNLSFNPSTSVVDVNVASWTDEASYLAGHNLVWMWPVDATPALLSDLDGGLATIAPFDSGSVIADNLEGLDAVKVRAWAVIKDKRDNALNSTFIWNDMVFDADGDSQQRIQGAVQLATIAAAAGQEFSIAWTLHDNTTSTLSGADMVNVGLALGQFVQANFAHGVTLRAAINGATTVEEVQAVSW